MAVSFTVLFTSRHILLDSEISAYVIQSNTETVL